MTGSGSARGDDVGRLLLARFSPFSAYKLALNAQYTYEDDQEKGKTGRYGLSLFGARVTEGEEVSATTRRICEVAECGGPRVALAWADELEAQGWTIVRDEPPPGHHLMGRGELNSAPSGEEMELVWKSWRVSNPTWER